MFWLYFAAGFFAFPLVIVLLFLLSQRRTAAPTQIGSSHELQHHLRGLLQAGKDGQTLFIAWTAQRFEIRVCKRDRTRSEDVVTGVSHAIQTVESALPSDPQTKRMVARHSVLYWLGSTRWLNSGGN